MFELHSKIGLLPLQASVSKQLEQTRHVVPVLAPAHRANLVCAMCGVRVNSGPKGNTEGWIMGLCGPDLASRPDI